MMPGDVVFWPRFQFPDGGDADKLFVVLNIQRNNVHLILKTTSRANPYRPVTEGCHAGKGYYHLPAKKHWFEKATWVVLHDPVECYANDLDDDCVSGRAKHMATLNQELLRAIVNCFKKADDYSEHHGWLLEPPKR